MHALQLVICAYVLNRLNSENLAKACYSLVEIYDWQQIDTDEQRTPIPTLFSRGLGDHTANAIPAVAHQQLTQRIYSDGNLRANGEKLVRLLDDLFNLVGRTAYSELDALMD